MFDLTAHVTATDLTARYPASGEGSVAALTYVVLGVAGESSELLEKAVGGAPRDAVIGELGDVLWYLSRLVRELGLDPALVLEGALGREQSRGARAVDVVAAAGRLAEEVKKTLRDDSSVLTAGRRARIVTGVETLLAAWLGFHATLVASPACTAAANVAKLLDRRDRDVISGEGDNR